MSADQNQHAAAELQLPRLSDDAVVQIHDFLEVILALFENRYGDQIRRFYDDLSEHNMIAAEAPGSIDDPPF